MQRPETFTDWLSQIAAYPGSNPQLPATANFTLADMVRQKWIEPYNGGYAVTRDARAAISLPEPTLMPKLKP